MKRRIILIMAAIGILAVTVANARQYKGSGRYNVMEYGAKGDGKALDSKAINKAIAAAAASGGGTVYLPAGNYLSGSIHLKSNISLYIDQGATVIATSAEDNGEYDGYSAEIDQVI